MLAMKAIVLQAKKDSQADEEAAGRKSNDRVP
jgi:hypothetical protein